MTERKIIETGRDVANPAPDRRCKTWDKMPTIPAGSRFLVRDDGDIISADGSYCRERANSPLTRAIVAAAVAVEPKTPREMMFVADCAWGGDEVLRILIKLGRVKPEDFAAVAAAVAADDNF